VAKIAKYIKRPLAVLSSDQRALSAAGWCAKTALWEIHVHVKLLR